MSSKITFKCSAPGDTFTYLLICFGGVNHYIQIGPNGMPYTLSWDELELWEHDDWDVKLRYMCEWAKDNTSNLTDRNGIKERFAAWILKTYQQ